MLQKSPSEGCGIEICNNKIEAGFLLKIYVAHSCAILNKYCARWDAKNTFATISAKSELMHRNMIGAKRKTAFAAVSPKSNQMF